MHILLIHQAFAALGEPGGTRHHELARWLARRGHRVTVLAGGVSYLTGDAGPLAAREWTDDAGVHIRRCATYSAWHRSFFHRVLSFVSFMLSSFTAGLRVGRVDVVWGTTPPLFQGVTAVFTSMPRMLDLPILSGIQSPLEPCCQLIRSVTSFWKYVASADNPHHTGCRNIVPRSKSTPLSGFSSGFPRVHGSAGQ